MHDDGEAPGARETDGRTEAAAAYDRLAERYDAVYDDPVSAAEDRLVSAMLRRDLRALHRQRLREAPDLTLSRSAPLRVLDVGCGTGWFLDNVGLDRVGHYRGFDLSEGMLRRAREKAELAPAASVFRGDLNEERPFYGRYDLVVSTFASPSYAASPLDFLARAARALRPGGRVFLMPHAPGNEARRPYLESEAAAYQGDVAWQEATARVVATRAGLTDVTVHGLRHPTAGPDETRSARAHDLWLRWERLRYAPDETSFLILRGTLA